jgi:NADH:ubiquinone oxidoreductase subunit 2 (subunit N)
VYQGLSLTGISLVSLVPKLALFVIMLKVAAFNSLLLTVGVFSIIIGSIGGLNQSSFKPLLAYSSIGHLGFVILAFSLNQPFTQTISTLYLVLYLFNSVAIFTLLLTNERKATLIVH